MKKQEISKGAKGMFSRRQFIKVSGVIAGGTAILGSGLLNAGVKTGEVEPDSQYGGIKSLRSACMMCNAGCGIQVKVKDGVAVKVDGNPYCPQTNEYASAGSMVVESDISQGVLGTLCARGQAGLKTLYDPYRIKYPLKRVGPRGGGQWEVISWDQAIAEICWGGYLPEGKFEGLAAIRNINENIGSAESDYMDEAPPAGYGYKSNQLVMLCGRNQNSQITKRFMNSFGSINHLGHTSICNSSYKVAGYQTFTHPKKGSGTYKFKPDIVNSDYLLLFGTNPVEANVPTNTFGRLLAAFLKKGGKLVVVDPRFSNTAAKATKWIPIKPGYDGAFALGMVRWLIENNKIAVDYLTRTYEDAAKKEINGKKYQNWTNATYLVDKASHKFLDTAKAGILSTKLNGAHDKSVTTITVLDTTGFPSKGVIKIGSEFILYTGKTDTTFTGVTRGAWGSKAADYADQSVVSIPFTVAVNGNPFPFNTVDQADLEFDGTVNGLACETSFTALKEEVFSKTVAEYETLSGVASGTIATIASEFAAANAPCADMYRGAFSQTNGFYNTKAIYMLNILLDRVDRAGGYCIGPRYKGVDPATPVAITPTGVKLDRSYTKYEGTKEKPTRQWYPLAKKGVAPEVLPSLKLGYPYRIKALITFTHNPAYTVPFPQGQIEALKDLKAVPLHINSTIFMDETAALADYILPDATYFEKWAAGPMAGYPTIHTKASTIRRPVVGQFDPITKWYTPVLPGTMLFDDVLIRIAIELGLPNFGFDGMGAGKDLFTAWQFYDEYFRGGDYGQGLNDNADYMRMGGKRENPAVILDSANPGYAKNRYGDLIEIFNEKTATSKNPLTGVYFSGVPKFEEPHSDLKGNIVSASPEFTHRLITFKRGWHTQSRSTSNEWLREIESENAVWLNSGDANTLGLVNGDLVKVTTPDNATGEIGRVYVTEEIRPGVAGVSTHFGRKEFGSKQYSVDGEIQPHDEKIGAGLAANYLMSAEPNFKDIPLIDPIGGGTSFSGCFVKIEKL